MNVEFVDHSPEIKKECTDAALRALIKCGLTAEGWAKAELTMRGAVRTGNLRNSITYSIDQENLEMYVGTDVEYGPYVELGTGAEHVEGGTVGWKGMAARPYLKPAIADHLGDYDKIIKQELKG